MAISNVATTQQNSVTNTILHGDCIELMRQMPPAYVDFLFSDPPYLVNYRDRSNRSILNDATDSWLKPAMAESFRLLKQDRVAIMFYGWTKVDAFFVAWKEAGFQPVGHLVFRKTYSSKSRFFAFTTRTILVGQRQTAANETAAGGCNGHALPAANPIPHRSR